MANLVSQEMVRTKNNNARGPRSGSKTWPSGPRPWDGPEVGQLAIEDMRQKAEAALGAEFKLPAFHEARPRHPWR